MFLNIFMVLFSVFCLNTDQSNPFAFHLDKDVFVRFKTLLINVREKKVSPQEAEDSFKQIMFELREIYPNKKDTTHDSQMFFPLTRSNISAVGGKGSGFYTRRFNLFDHAVSGSHPAHDIFIYDRNRDCIDDQKGDYVDIVSVGDGIVLASEKNWTDTSSYKGGNYVWVYDIERGGLWYYAHHRKVVVDAGQIVKGGDKLGEVGRSGFNALNTRSDTHLHLMFLSLDEDFYPFPVNYYSWLKDAIVVNKSTTAMSLPKDFNNVKALVGKKIKPLKTKYNDLNLNKKINRR